jgi:DNA-binding response OmpR family regulator
MRILLAEDDPTTLRVLETTLSKWGYQVVPTRDGAEALRVLEGTESPRLALLDWIMPLVDGLEVCRKVRTVPTTLPPYLILLTGKGSKEDIVSGFDAGADDYLVKPFNREELRARLRVGVRMVEMQTALVQKLEEALSKVKQLQGLVPICAYCKKVRDDCNYWQQVDAYMTAHTEARFSHGICPDCMAGIVQPEMQCARLHEDPLAATG